MTALPNYHNRQQPSDFAPYSNNAFSMQRNPRYDDRQEALENQKNLEKMLSQFKRKDAESENPFYDNSYQHNLNVLRGKPQEPTLDLRNQQFPSLSQIPDSQPNSHRNQRKDSFENPPYQNFPPVQGDRKPVERNEPRFFGEYDKKNLQDNNKGQFMSGLGENNRHANIVKEYQQYMRNNPIPAPKIGKGRNVEEVEKNRISVKKRNEQDQDNGWYNNNVGVGILPGMGGDNRRAPQRQNQQSMPEYRQPQPDRYGYDAPNEDYRRAMPESRAEPNLPGRLNHQQSGSRLAGIGSRILDSEPRNYYEQNQMRTPQYTPSKEVIRGNFQTPQHPRKSIEGGPGFAGRFKEMQGYSEGADRYGRGSYDEGPVGDFEWKDNQVQAPVGGQQRVQNGRRGDKDDGGQDGTSWLEQRQRQEQDKKQQQKDELQRIYREQIEEKKRKKEEEQRRQLMEDKKEEERLRRENEDLQRQFLLEQQKKKDAEQQPKTQVKSEVPDNDYVIQGGRKRPRKKQEQFETSADNAMRPEPVEVMQDYRPRYGGEEEMTLDDMIKETAKRFDEEVAARPRYEFSKDPEMEVHREVTRQINATLDDQLEKMKRDVEYHAKMLRNELTSYKTQAMVSQELRHNAQKELQRLKEDLRNQRVEEERRPFDNFDMMGDQGKGQRREQDRQEEKFSINLNKKYAKNFNADDDEGPNLVVSGSPKGGATLDFDTNYVMAAQASEGKMFREPPKLGELMNKYGVDDNEYEARHRKDNAMKKFDSLFPEHSGKGYEEGDSIAALEAQLNSNNAHILVYGLGQQSSQSKAMNHVKTSGEVARQRNEREGRDEYHAGHHQQQQQQQNRYGGQGENVEGEDEIERIENLLKRYMDPELEKVKEKKKEEKKEEHRILENKVFKEMEDEGITEANYMHQQYEYQDEGEDQDQDLELRDEEDDDEEARGESEVELANVTHEVDMSHNPLNRKK